jgi:hypothetical protein
MPYTSSSQGQLLPGAAGVGAGAGVAYQNLGPRTSTTMSQGSSSGRPDPLPLQGGGYVQNSSASSDHYGDSRTHSPVTSGSFSDRQQQPPLKGPQRNVANNEVIQHQDAGPIPEERTEEQGPTEVPPAYADIRRD